MKIKLSFPRKQLFDLFLCYHQVHFLNHVILYLSTHFRFTPSFQENHQVPQIWSFLEIALIQIQRSKSLGNKGTISANQLARILLNTVIEALMERNGLNIKVGWFFFYLLRCRGLLPLSSMHVALDSPKRQIESKMNHLITKKSLH